MPGEGPSLWLGAACKAGPGGGVGAHKLVRSVQISGNSTVSSILRR
jgi:hypothetical protein